MIHLPILRHVRRLISSAMIFGSVVLLMLWIPIRILKTVWPTFLPYTLSGDSEVNELSLQLLLLQVRLEFRDIFMKVKFPLSISYYWRYKMMSLSASLCL